MEVLAKAFGAIVLFVGAVIILIPLGTAFGALAGHIVGWLFGDTILMVLGKMGLHGVTMWQVGACCGFFGGFLRTSVSNKST